MTQWKVYFFLIWVIMFAVEKEYFFIYKSCNKPVLRKKKKKANNIMKQVTYWTVVA